MKSLHIIILLLALTSYVEASEDNIFSEQLKVGGFSSAAITFHRDAKAEAAINELSLLISCAYYPFKKPAITASKPLVTIKKATHYT